MWQPDPLEFQIENSSLLEIRLHGQKSRLTRFREVLLTTELFAESSEGVLWGDFSKLPNLGVGTVGLVDLVSHPFHPQMPLVRFRGRLGGLGGLGGFRGFIHHAGNIGRGCRASKEAEKGPDYRAEGLPVTTPRRVSRQRRSGHGSRTFGSTTCGIRFSVPQSTMVLSCMLGHHSSQMTNGMPTFPTKLPRTRQMVWLDGSR